MSLSIPMQRACAWSAVPFGVLFLTGFVVLAGFVPPPDPSDSAADTARLFREDADRIRLGMIVSAYASVLIVPWAAAITVQLQRAEGRHSVLSLTVFASAAVVTLEFLFPIFFWMVAAFRADRAPADIQTLNDLAWVPFIGLIETAFVMLIAVAAAILRDPRAVPVFPRWAGYFSLFTALALTPSSVTVFFKDGPLAWNGALTLYLALVVFGAWVCVTTYVVLKAIGQQALDERTTTAHRTVTPR